MEINREQLLNDIYQFAIDGSGMIIGKPGIGKSYILARLRDRLVGNSIVCLIIKIDNAFDASDQAIGIELGMKPEENWLDIFRNIKLENKHKAILIFDAFDAARDEKKRKGFLDQIKKAKTILGEKWNILVSVRTYDATKSVELTKIFPFTNTGTLPKPRTLEVIELDDKEIEEALSSNIKLKKIYRQSNPEFKEILRIPFFLHTLEIIAENSTDPDLEAISKFNSETQILQFLWSQKITETPNHLHKEKLLLKLTETLVNDKILSVPKAKMLPEMGSEEMDTFNYLRSEDILEEVSHNSNRIAYSHNILFDYAVSKICLDENIESLLNFINQDVSRPFFFRPSFIYFFTSLWYDNNHTFWELYKHLNENPKREIQLFVRLILNGTVASEYREVDDLKPILEIPSRGERNNNIRNLLQSIRFLREGPTAQDIKLLSNISQDPDLPFLFEFAFLLDRSIKKGKVEDYGIPSRNLLSYVLDNRESTAKEFINRIGAQRAIELVAKTYITEANESRRLLSQILEMLKEPMFDIAYFTNLSEEIKHILPHDPEFVAEVYKTIFGYTETSNEKTRIGSTTIMALVSNRIQDFEMCYYRLKTFFPDFLISAPEIGISTGVKIVNDTVKREKSYSSSICFEFTINERKYEFVPDYSSIWAEGRISSYSQQMAQDMIVVIEECIKENKIDDAKKFIDLYLSQAQVGLLWKLYFNLVGKFPDILAKDAFPFFITPHLMAATDTSFEIREVIGNANHLFSDSEITQIEEAAFKAYNHDKAYSLQSLLSMIPNERLQLKTSKQFMGGKERIKNIAPFTFSSSVSAYTTEDWLKEKGIDTTEPKYSKLNSSIQKLEEFNNQFLNIIPSYQDYGELLNQAKSTYQSILEEKDLPEDLVFTLLYSISKFCSICAGNLEKASLVEFNFIKEVILKAIDEISKYDISDINRSPARGYSPTPRTEAANALVDIFLFDKDLNVLKKIKEVSKDSDSVIRFCIINTLNHLHKTYQDTYKEIVYERLENETDAFVYSTLLSFIDFEREILKSDTPNIIGIINSNEQLFSYNNQFQDAYTDFLLRLLQYHQNEKAFETLMDAYKWPDFCNSIIFKLFKQFKSLISYSNFSENGDYFVKKIKIIQNYITKAEQDILSLNGDNLDINDPKCKIPLNVIDQIIIRIYFCLEPREKKSMGPESSLALANREHFYTLIKPVFQQIIDMSGKITGAGLIIGHTAHYFIKALNSVLSYDVQNILKMTALISKYSISAGYTFDHSSIQEIVKLTERLLADYRHILLAKDSFDDLLSILDIYIQSGWNEALELLWKLDEIYK